MSPRKSIRIFPHRGGYPTAIRLARRLNGLVVNREHSRYRKRPRHLLINYGATDIPYVPDLNQPIAVSRAVNKLTTFEVLERHGISIPPYTSDRTIAEEWDLVVCRTILNSRAGRGIVIVNTQEEDLPYAPLYTKYMPKAEEYRIHIFLGEVIVRQRKARRWSCPNPNWYIRTHDNGFNFVHLSDSVPECVIEQSERAVEALGLDFGAVDVAYNRRHNIAYVLEVNTAPKLEGTTLERYANKIMEVR